MRKLRIALVANGTAVQEALTSAFLTDEELVLEITAYESVDDTLEALVSDRDGVCVVRNNSDTLQPAMEILQNVNEAGIRTPVIILQDIASIVHERQFIDSGAVAAIPWDGTQSAMLRNVVRLAMTMRIAEEKLRESNDQLMGDILTVQDLRERAEEINANYVELAEEYAIAKDELQLLNNEKTKLFSIIAHDLRSPFTGLLGVTDIMARKAETLEAFKIKTYAKNIHQQASRVYSLLENLLDWARLHMNEVKIEPTAFDIKDIVANAIAVLGDVAVTKQINLVDETANMNVFADRYTIDAVVRNLINNGIKFTPKGGTITVNTVFEDNSNVGIVVSDNGVGMSEAMTQNLFQVGGTKSTRGTSGEAGTGLGLLLCKEWVEKNGGKISVTSEPDIGSKFTFTVPSAP